MNDQQKGALTTTMQTAEGEVNLLEILANKLKEHFAADTRNALGDTESTRQLIAAQERAIDALFNEDVKQLVTLQSIHHYGNSVAAIREAVALSKTFKDVTDQHGIFNAAIALSERASELGVVMKLNMPTAKEEDRFGTRPFLTVSKFHSESGDTVLMHPTPNATGCVHGR